MDRYLFRGKQKNGEWVYGNKIVTFYKGGLVNAIQEVKEDEEYDNFDRIHECLKEYIIFDFKTIGQCTGLKDKNGKLVFEGDIVNCFGGEYFSGCWQNGKTIHFTDITDYVQMSYLCELEHIEIIGNIHDKGES